MTSWAGTLVVGAAHAGSRVPGLLLHACLLHDVAPASCENQHSTRSCAVRPCPLVHATCFASAWALGGLRCQALLQPMFGVVMHAALPVSTLVHPGQHPLLPMACSGGYGTPPCPLPRALTHARRSWATTCWRSSNSTTTRASPSPSSETSHATSSWAWTTCTGARPAVGLSLCVHARVCVRACLRAFVCARVRVPVCGHARMFACVRACVCVRIRACACVFMRACVHVCVYVRLPHRAWQFKLTCSGAMHVPAVLFTLRASDGLIARPPHLWYPTVGEMSGGEMPVRKMPVSKMPVRKMPVRKMPVRKMPVSKMPVSKMPQSVRCQSVRCQSERCQSERCQSERCQSERCHSRCRAMNQNMCPRSS